MFSLAFGILSQQFRIFYTPIHLNVAAIENLVTCACILHNMIIEERGVPPNCEDLINNELESITEYHEIETGPHEELKFKIRDTFKDYFN